MIKKEKDGYHIYSHNGSRHLGGPYDDEDSAKKRLQQIEFFKRKQRTDEMTKPMTYREIKEILNEMRQSLNEESVLKRIRQGTHVDIYDQDGNRQGSGFVELHKDGFIDVRGRNGLYRFSDGNGHQMKHPAQFARQPGEGGKWHYHIKISDVRQTSQNNQDQSPAKIGPTIEVMQKMSKEDIFKRFKDNYPTKIDNKAIKFAYKTLTNWYDNHTINNQHLDPMTKKELAKTLSKIETTLDARGLIGQRRFDF